MRGGSIIGGPELFVSIQDFLGHAAHCLEEDNRRCSQETNRYNMVFEVMRAAGRRLEGLFHGHLVSRPGTCSMLNLSLRHAEHNAHKLLGVDTEWKNNNECNMRRVICTNCCREVDNG